MELAVLNDQFLPARLVENHSALIWTERHTAAGDFSRESSDIGGTLEALPIWQLDSSGKVMVDSFGNPIPANTIVTLRESNVPMLVETHKIEKSLTGPPKITTIGRSLETILDRRTTINKPLGGGAAIKPWTSVQKTAVDAAYDVMNQVVNLGNASVKDKIPEITIQAPIRPPGYSAPASNQNYTVDPGELYSWVLQQLQAENYGLRAVRPADASTTTISIEIYTGTDRTKEVVFDARFDQFDNSVHLLSNAGWKNVDQVTGSADSLEVTDGNDYSGLNRRVGYFDGSQLAVGAPSVTITNLMQNLGTVDLAKQLQTALFSGEVSRQMGNLYGKDYFLGDIVKLTGDYGLSQFVRISEFIRSEDNNGEKAYPTFASL